MNINNSDKLRAYIKSTIGKDEFLTYKEISRLFSIAMQTLYNDKNSGLLKAMNNQTHCPRFSTEEIFAYLIAKHIISSN